MKTLIFSLLCAAAVSAGNAQSKQFRWLIGTWKLDGKETYEVWKAGDDGSTLYGRSYTVRGADTTVTEVISLKFFDGSFHYIPDIAGDQPPIDFKMTLVNDSRFIAENPQHDFPKLIRYRYVRDRQTERLEAAIEGDGKVIPFMFQKVK